MKLHEIYSTEEIVISYEVFPPKSETDKLLQEINILEKHNPAFISLTYGAGGNENKSFELLKKIKNTGVNVMPHFTCISSSKESIEADMKKLNSIGIENILALRGDLPENEGLRCNDFCYANELVTFIKAKTNFSAGVAGYPEGHIESQNLKTDIENLKKKVDAGADVIFTQLFFDNNLFFDFVNRVRDAGIEKPVIAGIMPIISEKQVNKMTTMANITIPYRLKQNIQKYKDKDLIDYGIEFASSQCIELMEKGVKGLHFFTLNKAYSTDKILNNIKGKIWKN